MLGKQLEILLNDVFVKARAAREELVTTEHLLLGILEASHLEDQLSKLEIPVTSMRDELKEHIAEKSARLADDGKDDTRPTSGFQRTLQRAVFLVQSRGKGSTVSAKDILLALLQEKESFACKLMVSHEITDTQLGAMRGELEVRARRGNGSNLGMFQKQDIKHLTSKVFEMELKLDTAITMIQELSSKLDSLLDQNEEKK